MLLEDANNQDYVAEYLQLKAANDQLRERGKQWLWDTLETLCVELNGQLQAKLDGHLLQTGRQEWQFMIPTSVGEATMAGERFGVMKFGSRMDVFLPATATVKVRVGEKVKAAVTILAELGDVPNASR